MVEKNISDDIPIIFSTNNVEKLCTFLEIARHPNGLSVQDIICIFGGNKSTVWNHINPLLENHLISGRKMTRNGRRMKIFKATLHGVNSMSKEANSIGTLLTTVHDEMTRE